MTEILPGVREDLSNEAYHALTDWYSSSQLKAALPEHYKPGGSQDALDFGTLVHTVVLEPDNLGHYVVLDANKIAGDNPKTGKPYDAPHMTARFKAAVAEAQQDGHTVVAADAWERAHRMRDAVAKHETAARLLLSDDGRSEVSAFAVDENGVQHKARFDRHIPGVIVDLKSTSGKPGRDSLARSVIDYGYDLSAAHYLAVAELLGLDVQAFAFVFVGKEPPHHVTVCDLDEAFLERGRALRAKALRRHTDPTEPAYEGASGFLTIDAPGWALIREDVAS